ncbi:MAG: GHKL domain-containing protein [Eubacteriales bacterium]
MELFYGTFFLLQGILYAYLCKLFFDGYYRNGTDISTFKQVLIFCPIVLQSFVSLFFEFNVIIIVILGQITQIIPLFIYKSTWIKRILGHMLLLTFHLVFEGFVSLVFSAFFETSQTIPTPRSIDAVVVITVSRLLAFSVLHLWKRLSSGQNRKNPHIMHINLVLIPFWGFNFLVGFACLLALYFGVVPNLEQDNIKIALLISIFLIIFFIGNVLTYFQMLDLQEHHIKTMLQRQEMEHFSREHHILGEYLKEISVFKHNVKHELLPVLAKFPQEEKEILREFTTIFDSIFRDNYQYFTNYASLDLLLNHQLHKAQEQGVNLEILVESQLKINTELNIVAVILGNLLENALVSQENTLEKTVKLELANPNSNLFLKVENPYMGELFFEDGLPLTTKEKRLNHGLGLSSVRKLVEDDGGIFRYSTKNQVFIVEILLLNHG